MRRIILSPDAEAHINAIKLWYYHKEASLSFQFAAEVQFTLSLIAQYPYAFPLVKRGVRRALMKDFPYLILFALKGRTVSVIAVLHQHRRHLH